MLTRNSIIVTIYFGVRAVANEINRPVPGIHITVILPAVAFEFLVIVRDAKLKIGDYLWLR